MTDTANLPAQLHSRPGTEVGLPVQAPYAVDNEQGLTASDILMPRMKIVQKMSRVSDDGLADYGDVYVFMGETDMEPSILATGVEKGKLSEPVRFYVHADPYKAWSWTKPDKTLGRGEKYPPLSWVIGSDPLKVNRTYRYYITLPAYPILPVSFLMYGAWGGQAAKGINAQLVLAHMKGVEAHTLPFKLQTYKTQSRNNEPYVQAIVALDAVSEKDKAADLVLVEQHHDLIAATAVRTLDDEDVVDTTAEEQPTNTPSLD